MTFKVGDKVRQKANHNGDLCYQENLGLEILTITDVSDSPWPIGVYHKGAFWVFSDDDEVELVVG